MSEPPTGGNGEGGGDRRRRPAAIYSAIVGLVFIAIIAVAGINTLNTKDSGVLGAGNEGDLPLAQFAVPNARSELDGDANVAQACMDCGLDIPCTGLQNCQYNGNICVQTNNEPTCNLPMNGLSMQLCGGAPNSCQALWGVYQYMGMAWVNGSACGAEQNGWCTVGNSYMNKYALCVSM